MKKLLFFPLLLLITLLLLQTPSQSSEKQGSTKTNVFTNSIGMEFILIPAGQFQMGAHESEDGSSKEKPRHTVTISKPFYMGKYEVTQDQWQKVMGNNQSLFRTPTRPVERVSWDDAQLFITRLNAREKTSSYRLPTEAQWEYAARGRSETGYCFGDDPQEKKLLQYGWYKKNSNKQTQPVGELKPNSWGLHDMHGNVQEWVHDWYDRKYYSTSPKTDPKGPPSGRKRAIRGGSWINPAWHCRSAARSYYSSDYIDNDIGFRLVKIP